MEDEFEQIKERAAKSDFIAQSFDHTEECQHCQYLFLCRGGCRRHRDQPGTVQGQNYFCESYRMFFQECLSSMKEIAFLCSYR